MPDGYMYKDIMRVLAECGRFEQAIEIMHQMYKITQREDIHQFGESQLATLAGHMVGHMHTPLCAELLLLSSGLSMCSNQLHYWNAAWCILIQAACSMGMGASVIATHILHLAMLY